MNSRNLSIFETICFFQNHMFLFLSFSSMLRMIHPYLGFLWVTLLVFISLEPTFNLGNTLKNGFYIASFHVSLINKFSMIHMPESVSHCFSLRVLFKKCSCFFYYSLIFITGQVLLFRDSCNSHVRELIHLSTSTSCEFEWALPCNQRHPQAVLSFESWETSRRKHSLSSRMRYLHTWKHIRK